MQKKNHWRVLRTLLIASGNKGGKTVKKLYGNHFSSLLTLSLSTGIYTVKRLIFNKDKKKVNGVFCLEWIFFFFHRTKNPFNGLLF